MKTMIHNFGRCALIASMALTQACSDKGSNSDVKELVVHDGSTIDAETSSQAFTWSTALAAATKNPGAVIALGLAMGSFEEPVATVFRTLLEPRDKKGKPLTTFNCKYVGTDFLCKIYSDSKMNVVIGKSVITPKSINLCSLYGITVGPDSIFWSNALSVVGPERLSGLKSNESLPVNAAGLHLVLLNGDEWAVESLVSSVGPVQDDASAEEFALLSACDAVDSELDL